MSGDHFAISLKNGVFCFEFCVAQIVMFPFDERHATFLFITLMFFVRVVNLLSLLIFLHCSLLDAPFLSRSLTRSAVFRSLPVKIFFNCCCHYLQIDWLCLEITAVICCHKNNKKLTNGLGKCKFVFHLFFSEKKRVEGAIAKFSGERKALYTVCLESDLISGCNIPFAEVQKYDILRGKSWLRN